MLARWTISLLLGFSLLAGGLFGQTGQCGQACESAAAQFADAANAPSSASADSCGCCTIDQHEDAGDESCCCAPETTASDACCDEGTHAQGASTECCRADENCDGGACACVAGALPGGGCDCERVQVRVISTDQTPLSSRGALEAGGYPAVTVPIRVPTAERFAPPGARRSAHVYLRDLTCVRTI